MLLEKISLTSIRRRHVINEPLWNDYRLPENNHSIVKVLKSNGGNLHEVTTPSGEKFVASMPPKFRKLIWVKRGSYVLVEPTAERGKVKAVIVKILNEDSIKYYAEYKVWPKEFDFADEKNVDRKTDEDGLFVNTNRD